MHSRRALPRSPGGTSLAGEGNFLVRKLPWVRKGVLRAGNTQKETSDVERPRDHGDVLQSRGRETTRREDTHMQGDRQRRREEAGHDRYKHTETEEERQRETRPRRTGEVKEIWEHVMVSGLE